jgi:hypothetical protein
VAWARVGDLVRGRPPASVRRLLELPAEQAQAQAQTVAMIEGVRQAVAEVAARVDSLTVLLAEYQAAQERVAGHLATRLNAMNHELVVLRQATRHASVAGLLERVGDGATGLTRFELGAFSQNGEDGVLVEILRRLDMLHGTFAEIGASSNEANCIFLCDVLGWGGVFVDADPAEQARLERKYRHRRDVVAVQAMVTPANVEAVLREAGVADPTLLSIDIDGNDYWLWEALSAPAPPVVVIEHNPCIDPRQTLVQPPTRGAWDGSDYYGASLEALRRLGARKGYRLVHVELTGNNVFFVREPLAVSADLPEMTGSRVPNQFLMSLLHPEHTGPGAAYIDPDGEGG